MKYDVSALGECLIDFVGDSSHPGKLRLEGNAGGAPANVLACLSRLGKKTAFIGKVGADGFGRFLFEELKKAGIDVANMIFTDKHPTTVAVVTLDETGNRSFGFYRERTADVMLDKSETNFSVIGESRVFHFGSVSMTAQPSRGATLSAAEYANAHGVLVSYDPNLRESLWQSLDEAREVILQGMAFADIVKVSGEELEFLTGEADVSAGLELLYERYKPQLIAVTLGAQGCVCRCAAGQVKSLAYDVPCVDTTGAGDSFLGALLYGVLNLGRRLDCIELSELEGLLDFANACGSLTTTRKGAIPAMPALEEIIACMQSTPRVADTEPNM